MDKDEIKRRAQQRERRRHENFARSSVIVPANPGLVGARVDGDGLPDFAVEQKFESDEKGNITDVWLFDVERTVSALSPNLGPEKLERLLVEPVIAWQIFQPSAEIPHVDEYGFVTLDYAPIPILPSGRDTDGDYAVAGSASKARESAIRAAYARNVASWREQGAKIHKAD